MAQNSAQLQRFNYDISQWETIQYRYTSTGGVLSDFFFDTGVATRFGGATYRILVNDNNGNAIGYTTLLAVALSR